MSSPDDPSREFETPPRREPIAERVSDNYVGPFDAPLDPLPPAAPPPKESNWVPTCLIGCLVMFIGTVAVCGGVFWYVTSNVKRLATDFARNAAAQAIRDSELSDEDKDVVVAQIDRLADAYKAGDIELEDMGQIIEELFKSPLFAQIIITGAQEAYIKNSALSDDEKAEAKITLRRVIQGAIEEKISQSEIEELMDYISHDPGNGQRQMKPAHEVSEEELREFLAECKRLADEAEIPIDLPDVNIGKEFKKAIDEALKKTN